MLIQFQLSTMLHSVAARVMVKHHYQSSQKPKMVGVLLLATLFENQINETTEYKARPKLQKIIRVKISMKELQLFTLIQSSQKIRLRFCKTFIFFTYIAMFSIVGSFRLGLSSPQNSGPLTSLSRHFYKTLLNFKCSKDFACLLPASFVVEPKTPNSHQLTIRGWAIFKPIYNVIR